MEVQKSLLKRRSRQHKRNSPLAAKPMGFQTVHSRLHCQ
ncbi:hypothetical protein KEN51_CDS0007 [Pseudomonas phage vB_Pae10145-KEN51]|nr:hypothetical protein IPCDMZAV_CDS0340 [Pseudomonas phage 6B]WRQ05950.1 hypothetical protein QAMIJHJT_CDS0018 [Pseudomonas phage 9-Ps-8B]WRQ06358.1 hypothetical protein FOPPYZMZ_CDS0017 [Pseudomonas phage 9Ps-7B]WRQ07119.1 hypothetical protein ZBUARNPM_CDS0370 [Pseudomonas phage 14Ps5-6]